MRVVNSFLICSGISRSTTMVIVYLMTHLGMSFDAALAHTVACRACTCPNDGFRRQIEIFAREHRDKYLHQLHSDPKSQPLLDNDWKFIQSVTPSHNVEEEQHKLFHELMKRKQEVGIFRWNNQIEYVIFLKAGEHFGLEWLRDKMEKEEQAGTSEEKNPAIEL